MAELKELSIQFPGTRPNGRLRVGMGIAAQVGQELKVMTDRPVLVITDRTLVSLGVPQPVLRSLEQQGLTYEVFDEALPEPHLSTMQQLEARLTRGFGAVVGLGGGSALDVAKLAAVMAATGCTGQQLFDCPERITGSLPTVLLPTTSGTGSEVSPYSVMSDGQTKRFIGSPWLYATVAMVDPELTMTMPPRVTAATGLDALTHGVEGAVGKDNPYTRAMMLQCVRLVFTYLPRAVEDGTDREARYYMSLASVMGMLAYTQGGGLYAHSMSYVLTTGHGCPHGVGCGMTLPYTLRLNRTHIGDLLTDIGQVLGISPEAVPERFLELVQTVGMPTGLPAVGVTEQELDDMAAELIGRYVRKLNPVSLSADGARQLVQAMFEENLSLIG